MRIRVQRRRGLAIAPAVVCTVVVMLVAAGLVKQASTLRNATRNRAVQAQSAWLLESGLSRAAAQLDLDRKYTGETWEITADDLGLPHPGVVKIEVKPGEDPSNKNQFRVRVEAAYPRGLVETRVTSQTIVIDLGPETSGGTS